MVDVGLRAVSSVKASDSRFCLEQTQTEDNLQVCR